LLKAGKQLIHRMTSPLAGHERLLGNAGLHEGAGGTKETIEEMHALEASLTGLANLVPHGSTVVTHEDMNVWEVDCNQVRAVDKNEVRAGKGTIIRKRSESLIAPICRRCARFRTTKRS
jgi:hypothetical protein